MLKGNIGEWSELYVLVKLLANGELYQSDMFLNKDIDNVYKIIKAFKSEKDYNLEFDRNEVISIQKVFYHVKEEISTLSIDQFKEYADKIYEGIKQGKGRTFGISAVDDFLEIASIKKLKASSNVKSDIALRIYDNRLAKETDLGFSIKSLLGSDSTLFNAGYKTNFIYRVDNEIEETIPEFNTYTYTQPGRNSKISFRLSELLDRGCLISYKDIQSNQLWKNLKMIDGDLPEILSHALYYRYLYKESSIKKVSALLEDKDPMNFYNNEMSEQKMYEFKIKKFLAECAMGMTSEKVWHGEYDSFGGVIIAKKDGEIVCFHIYDFNLFRNYLLNNTLFEQASTGEDENFPGTAKTKKGTKKFYYGWLYDEEGIKYFKINLQIRFKK
jgi:hypothetical protein